MKKKLLLGLFVLSLLSGCKDSKDVLNGIDVENWSNEQGENVGYVYSQQLSNATYLDSINSYFSNYNYIVEGEDALITNSSLDITFDGNSTVLGNGFYSSEKTQLENGQENSEIGFGIDVVGTQDDLEPFVASGSLSLLYKEGNAYANVHDFSVFMGEGNMDAKLYTLLLDLVKDKWVDLEVGEGGIFQVLEDNEDWSYLGTMLLMSDIVSDANFVWAVSSVLGYISNYIDLGISLNNLDLVSLKPIVYGEYKDGTIEKQFEGTFESDISKFDMFLRASKRGFEVKLFDIQNINEDGGFDDSELEISFLMEEDKEGYKISGNMQKYLQIVADFVGILNFEDNLWVDLDFNLNPLELADGELISGHLKGDYKKNLSKKWNIPELSGDILVLSEMINALI